MKPLQLRLLGGLEILEGGEPIRFSLRNAAFLLSYLASYTGERHSRDKLANLLWGNASQESARKSLRQCLLVIRKEADNPELLVADSDNVGLKTEGVVTDVAEFLEKATGIRNERQEALSLFRGEFFAGITTGRPEFDAWVDEQRAMLRRLMKAALEQEVEDTWFEKQFAETIAVARRLVQMDPYHEMAHQMLMAGLAMTGQRNQALRIFDELRDRLRDELNVAPDPETNAVAISIRQGNFAALRKNKEPDTIAEPRAISLRYSPGYDGAPKVFVDVFEASSAAHEDTALADGLTEDLIMRLSRRKAFPVISRFGTFDAKESGQTRAKKSGAGFLVSGRVRRSGDRLRIEARLTDLALGSICWSGQFDGRTDEVFDLQDRASHEVTRAVLPEILDDGGQLLDISRPGDFSLWQNCHSALSILWRYDPYLYPEAISVFRDCISREPSYALAHAGLSYTLVHAYKEGQFPSEAPILDEALDHARRATVLDRNEPFAFAALGRTHLARQEFGEAIAAYQLALSQDPDREVALMGLGYALVMQGKGVEALPFFDRFDTVVPAATQNPTILVCRSLALTNAGQPDRAIRIAEAACQLPGVTHWGHIARAIAATALGNHDVSASAIEEAHKLRPDLDDEAFRAAYPLSSGTPASGLARELLKRSDIFRPRLENVETQDYERPKVRFATNAADGTSIAWARLGYGPPVLKAPNWMSHFEYEWKVPIWGPLLKAFAARFDFVCFDQRGNGQSQREISDLSLEAMIGDFDSVVSAAELDKFAILGISQGAAFSVRYAAEMPERVSSLVIFGGYVLGRLRRSDAEQRTLFEVQEKLISEGWGSETSTFRHMFSGVFMPDAPPNVASSFAELQRVATTPEMAVRMRRMTADIDVSSFAARVRAPTIVFHCAGDRVCPIDEGRHLARLIPNAEFVELPGNNHVLLEGTDEHRIFIEQASRFVRQHAVS